MPLRVRQNFEEKASYFAKSLPGMTVADEENFLRVDCGLPSDTFNVVVVRNLHNLPCLYNEGVEYFTRKGFPMALWCWEDIADPAGITTFRNYGLSHNETNVAMVADLSQVSLAATLPEGLRLTLAADPLEIEQYGTLLANSFDSSPEGPQVAAYFDRIKQVPLAEYPAMRHYLGLYQNQVVATGTLFLGSNTAGIYDIVTQAEYRRRGIGSAMFAHLLREAQSFAYQQAVLQASPDGLGIYQRAGFTAVGQVQVLENRQLLG